MRPAAAAALSLAFSLAVAAVVPALAAEPLRIGSKRFTESYILGEILLQAAGGKAFAEHRQGLGNTGIVFAALKAGSIDLYPEYTGTIAGEILKRKNNSTLATLAELNRDLAPLGLGAAAPFGFNNSYALGMREELAERIGVRRVSDLARHPALKFGLSQEFIGRADGWVGLARAYGLPQRPLGLDHGLSYEAIAAGRIEVMDLYSTDAKIAKYALRVLEDDRGYFPRYEAVILHRLEVPSRHPQAWRALLALEGLIDDRRMIALNAAAELEGRSFAEAAAQFFAPGSSGRDAAGSPQGPKAARTSEPVSQSEPAPQREILAVLFDEDLWRLTREHLLLTFVSLAGAIMIGVPLGALAARVRASAQPILALSGVIQTIPSLALLAFLITLLGTIGTAPALVALFLYALLPIVRNTHAGLTGIGAGMRQAALALGLSASDRLRLIELPLALPSILAGVKTSAVINVGTATIAAFIGAGGYGERIATGLALNDNVTLLAGAIPAAVLALAVQGLFELAERYLPGEPHG